MAYAALSLGKLLMRMGEKLFAASWNTLTINTENERFILNADKDYLKNVPSFDKERSVAQYDGYFMGG